MNRHAQNRTDFADLDLDFDAKLDIDDDQDDATCPVGDIEVAPRFGIGARAGLLVGLAMTSIAGSGLASLCTTVSLVGEA